MTYIPRANAGKRVDPATCVHPPADHYSWFAGDTLCVVCLLCNTILQGGVYDEVDEEEGEETAVA